MHHDPKRTSIKGWEPGSSGVTGGCVYSDNVACNILTSCGGALSLLHRFDLASSALRAGSRLGNTPGLFLCGFQCPTLVAHHQLTGRKQKIPANLTFPLFVGSNIHFRTELSHEAMYRRAAPRMGECGMSYALSSYFIYRREIRVEKSIKDYGADDIISVLRPLMHPVVAREIIFA